MPRPSEFPEWADGGSATISEPSSAKKMLGWIVEKPPFEFFNWWMNLTYLWLVQLAAESTQNISDIATNAANIAAHIAATAAHGATGAVVGTSNNQTFTGVNEFDSYTLIKQMLASSVPTPASGKIAVFLDSADGQFKQKDSGGTLERLALVPVQEAPSGSIDGVNTAFTLANTPAYAAGVILYLDGLLLTQGGGNDYTISGTAITMAVAPTAAQTLWAAYTK